MDVGVPELKILAYNFDQIVRVRVRRAREAQARTLTA